MLKAPTTLFSLWMRPFPIRFLIKQPFHLKLHGPTLVSLNLYDLRGQLAATIIDHQWLDYGKHIQTIDAQDLGLKPGAYVAVLTVDGKVLKQKMLKF